MFPLRFLSLWSINDNLNIDYIKDQLLKLKKFEMDGVVFHPRRYPGNPLYLSRAYMDIVSETILYAKKLGLVFYLYDEDGWPSGTAGGKVLERFPDSTCEWIEYVPEAQVLSSDTVLSSVQGMSIVVRTKKAVNSLNRETTEYFIQCTHEAYRNGLSSEAFDWVEGFFSDEVAFLDGHSITLERGGIPYSTEVLQACERRIGHSIIHELSSLFSDKESPIKSIYWEELTSCLAASFYRPIREWCEKHGKEFTAHLKGEENPYFQLNYSGSCFQMLNETTLPGIDALERYPSGSFFPRISASVARQKGSRAMVEAMGGAGWGVTPKNVKKYFLWLADAGIDTIILHLNSLNLDAAAIRDWPPSTPFHISWNEAFPQILAEVRTEAKSPTPTLLVICPVRGLQESFIPKHAGQINEHNGANTPDDAAGKVSKKFIVLTETLAKCNLNADYTDERTLEEQVVWEDGRIRLGKATYSQLLCASGCVFHSDILKQAMRFGVTILQPDSLQIPAGPSLPQVDDRTEIIPEQTHWLVTPPSQNRILLEKSGSNKTNSFLYLIKNEMSKQNAPMEIVLSDPADSIELNCWPLEKADKKHFKFNSNLLVQGENQFIVFGCLEHLPFVFLRGNFQVVTDSPYIEEGARLLQTEGTFSLRDTSSSIGTDLIRAGYPFNSDPVFFSKTLTIDKLLKNCRLQFHGVYADTLHVYLDGKDLGFLIDQWITPPVLLQPGSHELRLYLYPSTYNTYGPHHYRNGDHFLISPDQFVGKRNFVDIEGPEFTLTNQYRFVKCELDYSVSLVYIDSNDIAFSLLDR